MEIWIFRGGGYSVTSDLDLGKKLEIWIFGGGYSVTSDLDLRKIVENLDFRGGGGGYSVTLDLDLRKKVENLDFWGGEGVFCNFGFGLRGKSWKFGFSGEGGIL